MPPSPHNFSDGDKAIIKAIAWEVGDAMASRITADRARDMRLHESECLSRFQERVTQPAALLVDAHEQRCFLERSAAASGARAKFFGVCAVCAFAGGGAIPFGQWLWATMPQLIHSLL